MAYGTIRGNGVAAVCGLALLLCTVGTLAAECSSDDRRCAAAVTSCSVCLDQEGACGTYYPDAKACLATSTTMEALGPVRRCYINGALLTMNATGAAQATRAVCPDCVNYQKAKIDTPCMNDGTGCDLQVFGPLVVLIAGFCVFMSWAACGPLVARLQLPSKLKTDTPSRRLNSLPRAEALSTGDLTGVTPRAIITSSPVTGDVSYTPAGTETGQSTGSPDLQSPTMPTVPMEAVDYDSDAESAGPPPVVYSDAFRSLGESDVKAPVAPGIHMSPSLRAHSSRESLNGRTSGGLGGTQSTAALGRPKIRLERKLDVGSDELATPTPPTVRATPDSTTRSRGGPSATSTHSMPDMVRKPSSTKQSDVRVQAGVTNTPVKPLAPAIPAVLQGNPNLVAPLLVTARFKRSIHPHITIMFDTLQVQSLLIGSLQLPHVYRSTWGLIAAVPAIDGLALGGTGAAPVIAVAAVGGLLLVFHWLAERLAPKYSLICCKRFKPVLFADDTNAMGTRWHAVPLWKRAAAQLVCWWLCVFQLPAMRAVMELATCHPNVICSTCGKYPSSDYDSGIAVGVVLLVSWFGVASVWGILGTIRRATAGHYLYNDYGEIPQFTKLDQVLENNYLTRVNRDINPYKFLYSSLWYSSRYMVSGWWASTKLVMVVMVVFVAPRAPFWGYAVAALLTFIMGMVTAIGQPFRDQRANYSAMVGFGVILVLLLLGSVGGAVGNPVATGYLMTVVSIIAAVGQIWLASPWEFWRPAHEIALPLDLMDNIPILSRSQLYREVHRRVWVEYWARLFASPRAGHIGARFEEICDTLRTLGRHKFTTACEFACRHWEDLVYITNDLEGPNVYYKPDDQKLQKKVEDVNATYFGHLRTQRFPFTITMLYPKSLEIDEKLERESDPRKNRWLAGWCRGASHRIVDDSSLVQLFTDSAAPVSEHQVNVTSLRAQSAARDVRNVSKTRDRLRALVNKVIVFPRTLIVPVTVTVYADNEGNVYNKNHLQLTETTWVERQTHLLRYAVKLGSKKMWKSVEFDFPITRTRKELRPAQGLKTVTIIDVEGDIVGEARVVPGVSLIYNTSDGGVLRPDDGYTIWEYIPVIEEGQVPVTPTPATMREYRCVRPGKYPIKPPAAPAIMKYKGRLITSTDVTISNVTVRREVHFKFGALRLEGEYSTSETRDALRDIGLRPVLEYKDGVGPMTFNEPVSGVECIADAKALGLMDQEELEQAMMNIFKANLGTLRDQTATIAQERATKRGLLKTRRDMEVKDLQEMFVKEVVLAETIPTEKQIHQYLRRCESQFAADFLMQNSDQYAAISAAMNSNLKSPVQRVWYVLFDELWKLNNTQLVFQHNSDLLDPANVTSLAWQPLPRSELERTLLSRGLLDSLDTEKYLGPFVCKLYGLLLERFGVAEEAPLGRRAVVV